MREGWTGGQARRGGPSEQATAAAQRADAQACQCQPLIILCRVLARCASLCLPLTRRSSSTLGAAAVRCGQGRRACIARCAVPLLVALVHCRPAFLSVRLPLSSPAARSVLLCVCVELRLSNHCSL